MTISRANSSVNVYVLKKCLLNLPIFIVIVLRIKYLCLLNLWKALTELYCLAV